MFTIMRVLFAIIWLSFLSFEYSQAQTRYTTGSVDAKTYQLWYEGDWNELIRTGNEALKQGIDFYNLRLRMGAAWYEKKNYHQAIRHFQSAWKMNPDETALKEYLYFSNLFSGREYEAAQIEATMPIHMRSRINLSDHSNLMQVYGAYARHAGAPSSATDQFGSSVSSEGIQTITRGYHLLNIGMEHRAGSWIWLHHSYTHIQRSFFLYYNIGDLSFINPDDKTYINQYYLGATALIKQGLDVRAGFHFIHLLDYEPRTTFSRGRQRTVSESVTDRNIVGFISLNRRYPFITAGLTAYTGNVNNTTQYQQEAMISLFPFGNLNLYTTSVLTHQLQKTMVDNWSRNFIIQQRAGIKLTDRAWFEADATLGELRNFFSNEGLAIFNDTDVTRKIYGIGLHALLTTRVHLRLNYLYLEKESVFVPMQTGITVPEPISYSTNSITVSILWKR